jgi:hypothetical protein
MKKIVAGCLIVAGLVGVVGAAGSYVVYRKVRSGVSRFAELATVRDLEKSVRNQADFMPPASGELTPRQLERFLEVQQAVRQRLGRSVVELERKYRSQLEKQEATAADLPALVSAYGDLATGFVDGKRAQVAALNQTGFSLAEYRWVRSQAYAAIGIQMVGLDLAQLIDDVTNGRTPAASNSRFEPAPPAPGRNQDLVAPHRKVLEDNVGLAFFGL